MTTLTDKEAGGNHIQSPLDREVVLPRLGRAGLIGLELSAGHFYGGKSGFIGRVAGGEHRVIVTGLDKEGTNANEVVGSGQETEAALRDSLERMRTLETVRTRSIASIEMTPDSAVMFTTLEHYNPKIAPSAETYPVPDYLADMLSDDKGGIQTYENTVALEGWQAELAGMVSGYLKDDTRGQQLAESLKIRSLRHLTPEQAVKLSAAFVQDASRYSYGDVGSGNGTTRADKSTAAALLKEGLNNRGDEAYEGNGICRNIASNVKAVFESLKAEQADLSMLNNTYAVYGAGFEGDGYADSRPNPHSYKSGPKTGHAWNTFVTIDANGSALATVTDATWALGKDSADIFQHLDRTEVRAAKQIVGLFERSTVKDTALGSLAYYTNRLIKTTSVDPRMSQQGKQDIREFAVTEYLKAAGSLDVIPDAEDILPSTVVTQALRMSGEFDKSEITTLFALDKASGGDETERLKTIIKGYDKGGDVRMPDWMSAEKLVFTDNELQVLAYDAIGAERTTELAADNGMFRARLRGIKPDMLPAFDIDSPADAEEFRYLASRSGIHDKSPRMIMGQVRMRLKRAAGDERVYNAVVAGRSDYDLVSNLGVISAALREADNT